MTDFDGSDSEAEVVIGYVVADSEAVVATGQHDVASDG